MFKFILLSVVLFAAVSCDDNETTEEDLEALWAVLPPGEKPPVFSEILAKMTNEEKDQLKQWLTKISQESARANLEFGEYDLKVLRKLVAQKVPGYETFLDENGEPTEAGRLRLYKALGYYRVSK